MGPSPALPREGVFRYNNTIPKSLPLGGGGGGPLLPPEQRALPC